MSNATTPRKKQEKQERLFGAVYKDKRYERVESLGEGGFGAVVRDFDCHLHRSIARKIPHAEHNTKNFDFERFLLNEARLLSYLNHPGIVPIFDAYVDPEGNFCYTMQVLEGRDLYSVIRDYYDQRKYLPLSEALQIFTKVCETMAFVHDKGVLHLDLKPENVMVGTYGEVLVLDWGTARLYDNRLYMARLANASKEAAFEMEDAMPSGVATISYAPLEQICSPREELRPTADIFSAGALLYYCLTLHFPYAGDTTEAYSKSLRTRTPVPLAERRGDIPQHLSQLCMSMLQRDPASRPQSFHEVLTELRALSEAGGGFPTHVYQAGEVLMHEGEYGNFALHILEGEVEISIQVDGKKRVLTRRESGDVIGELAVFSGGERTATVTALSPTRVKILHRKQIEDELEKLNPWISHMVRGLSNKFKELSLRQGRE